MYTQWTIYKDDSLSQSIHRISVRSFCLMYLLDYDVSQPFVYTSDFDWVWALYWVDRLIQMGEISLKIHGKDHGNNLK